MYSVTSTQPTYITPSIGFLTQAYHATYAADNAANVNHTISTVSIKPELEPVVRPVMFSMRLLLFALAIHYSNIVVTDAAARLVPSLSN